MPKLLSDLPGLTFSRASAATALNADGSLAAFSSGQPRQTDAGLWIAGGGVTNLFARSEAFDHAGWSKSGSLAVAANAATAPVGGVVAEKLIPAGAEYAYQNVGALTGVHNVSFFLKAAGMSHVWLDDVSGQGAVRVLFDVTAGAVETVTFGANAAIASAGNGWWRVSADTINLGGVSALPCLILNAGANGNAAADGVKGVYAWGAQLTAGSGVKDYVPTTAAPATQLADSVQLTRAGPSRGTIYCEFTTTADLSGSPTVVYGGGAGLLVGLNGLGRLQSVIGSTYLMAGAIRPTGAVNRAALSWSGRGRSLCLNGGDVASDDEVMTAWTSLTLGSVPGPHLNGSIRDLRVMSYPMGASELQDLTRL